MSDTDPDTLDVLIIISCILSLLGGLALLLTCLAPANRRKHARQLLFWLSFSDTITSVTYIVSVMFPSNDLFCKTTALISIFFPVASFLWTDIIALYLYTIVVSRVLRNEKEWRHIMCRYHWFVWGLSFVIILLVGVTEHEGRPEPPPSADKDSTLGLPSEGLQWCWVRGDTPEEQFVWELVGGKVVEWGSCVFISVVYVFIIRQLFRMNLSRRHSSSYGSEHGISQHTMQVGRGDSGSGGGGVCSPLLGDHASAMSGVVCDEEGEEEERRNSWEEEEDEDEDSAAFSGVDTVSLQSGRSRLVGDNATSSDDESNSGSEGGSFFSNQDLVVSEVSGGRGDTPNLTQQNTERNATGATSSWRLDRLLAAATRDSGGQDRENVAVSAQSQASTGHSSHGLSGSAGRRSGAADAGSYFNKFFLQMSIVPCLFFFARFWGSLRVVLQYANPSLLDRAPVVGYMQAVMDPSQGFCNFLLFVMTSEEERRGLWRNMAAGAAYLGSTTRRLGAAHIPGFEKFSTLAGYYCCCCCCSADPRCRVGADAVHEKDQSYVSVGIGEDEDETDTV